MAKPGAEALNNLISVVSMLAFAGAWYIDGIYTATAVLMSIMTLHVLLLFIRWRSVPRATLLMWLLVVILGGITLLLRDKAFIQLKTTVVYSSFAVILIVTDLMDKNLPKLALGAYFDAPRQVWRRVTLLAAFYFLSLAVCNYFVARYLSEGAWVSIKTFAFPAATFIFMSLMIMYLYRYMRKEEGGTQ